MMALVGALGSGCIHAHPKLVAPVSVPVAFDPSLLDDDVPGLTDAAERLCAPLTSAEQKATGFALAQRAHALGPKDSAAVRADWESDGKAIEAVTAVGIEAAKAAGAPRDDPRAAYWLGLNLGLALRQKGLEGIGLLPQEIATLQAAQAAPDTDQGGPLRVLGMLYLKAPAWPTGPGDLEMALDLLKQSVEKYPSHPLNHLCYAQALRQNDKGAEASAELKRASELAIPELWGDYAAKWQADVQAVAK